MTDQREARRQRLGAALRENLKRRKAQAKALTEALMKDRAADEGRPAGAGNPSEPADVADFACESGDRQRRQDDRT